MPPCALFVGTLPFSCLLGFLRRLIVAVGWLPFVHCWYAWVMYDVVLMVVPTWGESFEEHFWRDGGCDRMSLAGESYTFGTSLLEMSCCTSPLSTGCSPGNRCLGWKCPTSVVRAILVGGLCVGCRRLAFVVSLWWGSVDVWQCGAYAVWVGILSLQMSNDIWAAPKDIPHNFVNCISLKF